MNAPSVEVQVVDFPETRVAAVEHHGSPQLEHQTAKKLIEWRMQNRISPDRHRTYGVHYTDPRSTPPDQHRVDFCVSFDQDVRPNLQGLTAKIIPAAPCAVARYVGSREDIPVAAFLYDVWLPSSGEQAGDFPIFFHYVNVGPHGQAHEMITDVYLPLVARK